MGWECCWVDDGFGLTLADHDGDGVLFAGRVRDFQRPDNSVRIVVILHRPWGVAEGFVATNGIEQTEVCRFLAFQDCTLAIDVDHSGKLSLSRNQRDVTDWQVNRYRHDFTGSQRFPDDSACDRVDRNFGLECDRAERAPYFNRKTDLHSVFVQECQRIHSVALLRRCG